MCSPQPVRQICAGWHKNHCQTLVGLVFLHAFSGNKPTCTWKLCCLKPWKIWIFTHQSGYFSFRIFERVWRPCDRRVIACRWSKCPQENHRAATGTIAPTPIAILLCMLAIKLLQISLARKIVHFPFPQPGRLSPFHNTINHDDHHRHLPFLCRGHRFFFCPICAGSYPATGWLSDLPQRRASLWRPICRQWLLCEELIDILGLQVRHRLRR